MQLCFYLESISKGQRLEAKNKRKSVEVTFCFRSIVEN